MVNRALDRQRVNYVGRKSPLEFVLSQIENNLTKCRRRHTLAVSEFKWRLGLRLQGWQRKAS
jgi:hypothetical protein